MKTNKFIRLITTCLILLTGHSLAEVYKWVDENGKIHYTDKPPQHLNVEVEEVKIKSSSSGSTFKLPRINAIQPINNSSGLETKTVLLEYASIKLDNASSEKTTVVGKAFKFTPKGEKLVSNIYRKTSQLNHPLTCVDDGDLDVSNAEYILKLVDLITPFQEVFSHHNYSVVSKTDQKFSRQQSTSSDLSIGATITHIKLAHCGKSNSSHLNVHSQNATYLKINWQVFDNLTRKIVFETNTEGSDNFLKSVARKNGAPVSFGLAFKQAVEGLLAEQGFVDILTNQNNKTFVNKDHDYATAVKSINVSIGNTSTQFSDQVDKIKQAAATIRTTSGHGSGFVITHTGYVLTNQHVTKQNSQLMVIIQDKEYMASLVKSDPKRDVALLKIEGDFIGRAVKISDQKAKLGEKIYVVGTPLDEMLDFSITSGIISATREINGNSFYQTDAAVNPGNSGGPVFDEYGNVIGITVAGHFTKDGGSQNINYLIPIASAFASLGIQF